MKAFVIFALATATAFSAHAYTDFCAPQAVDAAKALANANGTISQKRLVPKTIDGLNFIVSLTEDSLQDHDSVVTTGGHDCLVKSVEVLGQPTPRS